MRRNAALCWAMMVVLVEPGWAGDRGRRPMPDLVPGEIWLSDGHLRAGVDNRGNAGGAGTFQCTLGVAGKGAVRSEGDPHPVPVAHGRAVLIFPESNVARLDPTLSGPFTIRVRAGVRESDASNNQFVGRIGVGR